jgi:hypothetical protein
MWKRDHDMDVVLWPGDGRDAAGYGRQDARRYGKSKGMRQ